MKERLEYLFGEAIPDRIRDKLDGTDLFPELSEYQQVADSEKDCFTADGTPVHYDPNYLYPVYAAWYMGTPIPSSYLDVNQGYRKTAALAAIEWIAKLLPEATGFSARHHNGQKMTAEVNGQLTTFCWPDTHVELSGSYGSIEIPVIPFPDSRDNEDDWSDGCTPTYAELQARMTLWLCNEAYAKGLRPTCAEMVYLVRITGNTASDVTVRAIKADPKRDKQMVSRIVRAAEKARAAGTDPVLNLKRHEQLCWLDKKNEERAEAYVIDSAEFHELLGKYMEVRSNMKAKEMEKKAISDEMDSIAIHLASQTSSDALKGVLEDKGIHYSVTHTKKNSRSATISANLVRQFYPEHIDLVRTNTIPRGRIEIEVL